MEEVRGMSVELISPPEILTWYEGEYLEQFYEEFHKLRGKCRKWGSIMQVLPISADNLCFFVFLIDSPLISWRISEGVHRILNANFGKNAGATEYCASSN